MMSNYSDLHEKSEGAAPFPSPGSKVNDSLIEDGLPTSEYLRQLCWLGEREIVSSKLEQHLIEPVQEFLRRPSKNLRAALVHAGYLSTRLEENIDGQDSILSSAVRQNINYCAQVIEYLHAGSLIVDDVQDQSELRRGLPCYHKKHGIPQALTAGNWLYIWPFRLIDHLKLEEKAVNLIRQKYIETLELAHYGQALDVSINVDKLPKAEVSAISCWITRHKTGSVTSLAFQMGAILGGADEIGLAKIADFGLNFGTLLQNYDDLGNFLGHGHGSKKYEDLRERRSSWIWAIVANQFNSAAYQDFIDSVTKLPNESALNTWVEKYQFIAVARELTENRRLELQEKMESYSCQFSGSVRDMLFKLCERLSHAYTG